MAYEQHEWNTGETITAAKMNNIEEGIAEAAQSGGGYDLVLAVHMTESGVAPTAADVVVEQGSIEACEAKAARGEMVNAVFKSWFTINDGNNNINFASLDTFDVAYQQMMFMTNGGTINVYYNSNYEVTELSID